MVLHISIRKETRMPKARQVTQNRRRVPFWRYICLLLPCYAWFFPYFFGRGDCYKFSGRKIFVTKVWQFFCDKL